MKLYKAFRFELMPNDTQQWLFRRAAGACRFVYNKGFNVKKLQYLSNKESLSKVDLINLLPGWKKDPQLAWLKEEPSQPLQQSLRHLDTAFQRFFDKKSGYPKQKERGDGDSFSYPSNVKLKQANALVYLPKIGWVRYRMSQKITGDLKGATVSYYAGKWFISLKTEYEREDTPLHPNKGTEVGIDMGVAHFATLSDDTAIPALNSLKNKAEKLAKYQRRMARKKKGSQNWKKAKDRVSRIHRDIRNARRNFQHQLSSLLTTQYEKIYVEDLQIGNMTRSSKGTVENPGKRVRQKSGLNKAILDQGWGEFIRQLQYKAVWKGGSVHFVPPAYTSQTCPHCGHVAKENRPTQALFHCVSCHYENNADVVGAINILQRGQSWLACGGSVQLDNPTKQESLSLTKPQKV